MATKAGSRPKGPYGGRSPPKKDDDVDAYAPTRAKAAKMDLAEKAPPGTSPTPPGRRKVTAAELTTELSPSAPAKERNDGDFHARLEALELNLPFWLKAQGTRGQWRPGLLSLES